MRKLYLAGLPRLQSVASVPHCRGSFLADESHSSSTYPLGTVADQTATVVSTLSTWCPRQTPTRSLPGYFRRTVPPKHLQPIAAAVDEQKQAAIARGGLKHVSHQSAQPIKAVPHVRRPRVQIDPQVGSKRQHEPHPAR